MEQKNIKMLHFSAVMNKYISKAEDAGAGMYNFDLYLPEFRKETTYTHKPYESFILQTYEKGSAYYGCVWLLCYYEERHDSWNNDCIGFDEMTEEEQNAIIKAFNEQYGDTSKYRIGLVDGNVELPDYIDIEYESLEDALNVLCKFVHSFDGKGMIVDGRVMNGVGDDVEYCSAIPELPKKTYKVYVRIGGYACQEVVATSPEEAEKYALEHKDEMGDADYSWWDTNDGTGESDKAILDCFPTERKVVKVEEI